MKNSEYRISCCIKSPINEINQTLKMEIISGLLKVFLSGIFKQCFLRYLCLRYKNFKCKIKITRWFHYQ